MTENVRVFRLLSGIPVRQFDRNVWRRAYHNPASIRMGVALQCLKQQHELFGEHEHIL